MGKESIVLRQFNDHKKDKFSTYIREAYLLDQNGNTSFPNTVTAKKFNGTANKAIEIENNKVILSNGTKFWIE